MAATANRVEPYSADAGRTLAYPQATNTHIFDTTLVNLNASGYSKPAAATVTEKFAGVARYESDNNPGSNGDKTPEVFTKGSFRFAKSGTIVQGDVGKPLMVVDDETVALAYATGETDSGGTNNNLDWTALVPGRAGEITIQFLDPEAASQPLKLLVTPDGLIFSLATGAGSAISTTADDIKNELAANAVAAAMVAAVDHAGDDGSAAVTAQTIKLSCAPLCGVLEKLDGSLVWCRIDNAVLQEGN